MTLYKAPSDTSIAKIFEQPYLYVVTSWTATYTAISFSPFAALKTNPVWSSKLLSYIGFRGKCRLRFQVNGNPFLLGRMAVGWTPNYISAHIRNTAAYQTGYGITALPHILLDPSSTVMQELEIPFTYPNPWLDLTSNEDGAAFTALALVFMDDLFNLVNSNGATLLNPVAINVYVSFHDVELVGRTGYGVTLPTGIVTEVSKVNSGGPVTAVSGAIMNIATRLKHVPFIGPMATATEVVAGAVNSVAAFFGWSRPNVDTISRARMVTSSSGANGIGPDTSRVLALDPRISRTIDPRIVGFNGQDELSFAFIKERWGLLDAFIWNDTSAVGTVLRVIPIAPTVLGPQTSVGTNRVISPVAGLGLVHEFWRGKLQYRIIIVASPMMRGRVQVRQAYPGTATLPSFQDNNVPSCIIDLGQQTVKDVETEHLNPAVWLPTNIGAIAGTAALTNSNFRGFNIGTFESTQCNGALLFEVIQPLTASYTPMSCGILVYVRGPDVEFSSPSLALLGSTAQPFATPTGILSEAPPKTETTLCHLAEHPIPIPPDLAVKLAGEASVSVRALLKRYTVLTDWTTGPLPGYVTANYFGSGYFHFLFAETTATSTCARLNFIDYFKFWFTGFSGGYRYRVTPCQDSVTDLVNTASTTAHNTSDPWQQAVIGALPFTSQDATYTPATYPIFGVDGSTFAPTSLPFDVRQLAPGYNAGSSAIEFVTMREGTFEFTVPDGSPDLYTVHTPSSFFPASGNVVLFGPGYARYLKYAFLSLWACMKYSHIAPTLTTQRFPPRILTYRAAAEDFTYVGYMGPPLMSFGF